MHIIPLRLRLTLLATVAVLFVAAPAAADDHTHSSDAPALELDGTPRSQLILALSGLHAGPTPAALEATGLSDDALREHLLEIAADTVLSQLARGRALDALVPLADAATVDFVATWLSNRVDENLFLTGRAIRLAGAGLAHVDARRALALVEPFLTHDDVGLRGHAVSALGELRTHDGVRAEAERWLLQLAFAERDPGVTEVLEPILASMRQQR